MSFRYAAAVRLVALLALTLWASGGCGPTLPPVADNPAAGACDAAQLAGCEQALLRADDATFPTLLERYASTTAGKPYAALLQQLRAAPAGRVWLQDSGAPPPPQGVTSIAAPAPPKTISRQRLLLRVLRAAKRDHAVLASASGLTQLFPRDVLAPYTLGLPAVLHAAAEQLATDEALAAGLRAAFSAASRYDYVSAADAVDTLRARLRKHGSKPPSEAQLRIRYGIGRLAGAGIALQRSDEVFAAAAPAAVGALSGPYADIFAISYADGDANEAYARRRQRLNATLSPTQMALLDARHSEQGCPVNMLPAMDRAGDMTFSHQLAMALDAKAAPGEKPAPGRLALSPWLTRYDALTKQVVARSVGWAFAATLLTQRGELHGLSAEGTATYQRVTQLALKHVQALSELSAARPARFQTLGVLGLVYRPGTWTDPRLSAAVAKLAQDSVQRKLLKANTVEEAWSATLSAFAAGLSYPPQLQGVQLTALKQGLAQKLASPFGRQGGWSIAGLHGALLLADVLLQREGSDLAVHGERIGQALDQAQQLPLPELARLAAAASRYLSLAGKNQLDASVTNPRMFSPLRRQAREGLMTAISSLAPAGPATPGEKDLRNGLSTFADEMIAATFARFAQQPDGVQCAGRSAIAPKTALRDVYDRLRKKRRTLLRRPEMSRGEGAWVQRARLLLVVLSDVLDLVDQPKGKLHFAIDEGRAQRIAQQALSSFGEQHLGKLGASLYLIGRSALADDKGDARLLVRNVARALNAIAGVLDEGDDGMFAALAAVGGDKRLLAGEGAAADVLIDHASSAYLAGQHDRGDILLMVALGTSLAQDETPPPAAAALARKHDRPIRLPLMLFTEKTGADIDRDALAKAMHKAVQASCEPPSPAAVLLVRRARSMFRAGKRAEATALLDDLLVRSARDGLVVPRQTYRYRQMTGGKIFNVDQSLSFAGPMLRGSGSLQVGLGYQSNSRFDDFLKIAIAPVNTPQAKEEAARLYAHTAIVASVYHRLLGEHRAAEGTARRALEVWANGVRLGDVGIPLSNSTSVWTADAIATTAIAAQQAADHGSPFLAGDLWTMVLNGLGEAADDSLIAEELAELPYPLVGISALTGQLERARKTMPTLAAQLACTKNNGSPERYQRVGCEAYPAALALRVAGGLSTLPRLKKPRACASWRDLDGFLRGLDEQRYEPTQLLAALKQLRQDGRHGAAATLVARQRHPNHCSPQLVKHVRALATRNELGVHLRASLYSIVANCNGAVVDENDIQQLDELTQHHALPNRSFELLVFVAKLAIEGRYEPLRTITRKPAFVRRWHKLGPQMGAAALLLQHAGAIGSDEPVDETNTLPFYRLLCTTFAARDRGPICNSIGMMRSDGAADKKQAAKKALESFVRQALSQ